MTIAEIIAIAIGIISALIAYSLRVTIKNVEQQVTASIQIATLENSHINQAIAKIEKSVEHSNQEQREAAIYFGRIIANIVTDVEVLKTIVRSLEKSTGHPSNIRFPAQRPLSDPPDFLPNDARVQQRQTGVENTGRYAAYVPPGPGAPPRPGKK